jgi:hypothetical protein
MLEQKKREVKFFSLPFILKQIYPTNACKMKISVKRMLKGICTFLRCFLVFDTGMLFTNPSALTISTF